MTIQKFCLIPIIILVSCFSPLKVIALDESKELVSGQVLRVALLHVRDILF